LLASCYLERQYRKGDPGLLLIGLGAAAIGAYALGGCVGSLYLDTEDWCMARRGPLLYFKNNML